MNIQSSDDEGWKGYHALLDGPIINMNDLSDSHTLLHELSHLCGTLDYDVVENTNGLFEAGFFSDIALQRSYNFGHIEDAIFRIYSGEPHCMLPWPK